MKTYEVMMRKPYDETRGNSLQNSVFKEHSQSMTIYPYTDMTDYRSKFMASPALHSLLSYTHKGMRKRVSLTIC